jgi:hypothetical protein
MIEIMGLSILGLIWWGTMMGITKRIFDPLLSAWGWSEYDYIIWPYIWAIAIPTIMFNIISGSGSAWDIFSPTGRQTHAALVDSINTWRQLRNIIKESLGGNSKSGCY